MRVTGESAVWILFNVKMPWIRAVKLRVYREVKSHPALLPQGGFHCTLRRY